MSKNTISYNPENAGAFFRQIEQWKDQEEFTRAIKALEAIPERDYRLSFALGQALVSYVIIGNHGKVMRKFKREKALRQAIEELESIREEGQDQAEWNKEMAFAYQQLPDQEEKAIEYARRWGELDPENDTPPVLVRECELSIIVRNHPRDAMYLHCSFSGSVLLAQAAWDTEQFIRDLKADWGIEGENLDCGHDLRIRTDGMILDAKLFPYPIPGSDTQEKAESNDLWPEALQTVKAHQAHIMIAVVSSEDNPLEQGKLFTKALAACCKQPNTTGICTGDMVFAPQFYAKAAEVMKQGELPVLNWVWIGVHHNQDSLDAFTRGMEKFDKDEMEVLNAATTPDDLRNFLARIVDDVLENDLELIDGDTVAPVAGEKHLVTFSPAVYQPEDEMTVKISWQESKEKDGYDGAELTVIKAHIDRYFGPLEEMNHEPDSPVDIAILPPDILHNYYTLVTIGMGAQRMPVPKELAERELERAELVIALPTSWKLDEEALKDERWYWPFRLLRNLARNTKNSWLYMGHAVPNPEHESYAKDTRLCAALLIEPQNVEDEAETCSLPHGDILNFYQVFPLYEDELDYKLKHGTDELTDKMDEENISFVADPARKDTISYNNLYNRNFSGRMDDAYWHLEAIKNKKLPVEEIAAFNHMAIYLSWAIAHDLMSENFQKKHGDIIEDDLREFIRDELDGQLTGSLFNSQGRAFASYYYGYRASPYYPSDIDDYAFKYFGPERYKDESYLLIPFDEDYRKNISELIDLRYKCWQNQRFDEETLLPDQTAIKLKNYLDCDCVYFPAMKDDDPFLTAYRYAFRQGKKDGYVPVLIRADDEDLVNCLFDNAAPGVDNPLLILKNIKEFREKMLKEPVKDGKAYLDKRIAIRKQQAEEYELDWAEEIISKMTGGFDQSRPFSCWNNETHLSYPLMLAKIPVENPWEIFAYLPFGNWHDCPDTPDLMAVAKYWYEKYQAVPAVMTNEELEFLLPEPVPKDQALDLAVEHYGFCENVIDQAPAEQTLGALADILWRSRLWYFWWE